jgi:hypothetical protein
MSPVTANAPPPTLLKTLEISSGIDPSAPGAPRVPAQHRDGLAAGAWLSKRAWYFLATLHVADIPYALFQRSQVLFNSVR